MINQGKMVFFNIAWMRNYQGNWKEDIPVNGGDFIRRNHWGGEVYNFQPYQHILYGYVEPGVVEKGGKQRNINISRLMSKPYVNKNAFSISNVLVVWVATPENGKTPLLVGWYENATLYRKAQIPPRESGRNLPNHPNLGEYFTSANKEDCILLPIEERTCTLPRKGEGFGRSNIWYAESHIGFKTREKVINFIKKWKGIN